MQKVVARPAEGETLDGKLRFIVKSATPQIVERRAAGWRLQILKPATHSVAERPKGGRHLDNGTSNGSGCEGARWGKK